MRLKHEPDISHSPPDYSPIVRHHDGLIVSIDLTPCESPPEALLAAAFAAVGFCKRLGESAGPGAQTGTPFQRDVWGALLNIPTGETRTYAQIAQEIGAPHSARAVANACGANRLALIVPCHRVVPARGGIGGYRWGVGWKWALLAAERGAAPCRPSSPELPLRHDRTGIPLKAAD